jgi:acetyltransferase-like isoleucine patch superfamily enzyme
MEKIPFVHKIRWRIYKLYETNFMYRWPEFRGWVSLRFYRFLYPNFHVGKASKIWGKFFVSMLEPLEASIVIGDHLRLVSEQRRAGITQYARSKLTAFPGASIVIGDHVAMTGVTITSKRGIEIGDHTIVAPNVIIIDSDFHVAWPPEKRMTEGTADYDKEICIGRHVWIGVNAIILKGVTIGDNSIIGAGSVVVRDIPANVVAAGNPARVVKELGQE